MKKETNPSGKSRLKGFYTALLISLAMIGAACVYAYQATTVTLEQNLESLQSSMSSERQTTTTAVTTTTSAAATETTVQQEQAVAGLQTDLPRETVAESEREPESEPEPELESEPESEPAETEDDAEADASSEAEETLDHVLVMPLEGEVLQPFSEGELVKSETTGTWQTHNGVDIAGETGTAVYAMDNGTVTDVTKDALWGITVTIDHGNGVISRYCGLSASLAVKEGDLVESGQSIGAVGTVPDLESKLASHLHVEVCKNGVYVNPMEWVTAS